MANESSTIVQRLWSYCNILRDDGISYGDYVEQLTYLLFLKMADEQINATCFQPHILPEGLDWQSLVSKNGNELEKHYKHILSTLGNIKGILGIIFRNAKNKIQSPAKLKRLIELINGETWIGLDIDVKGEIYEGLLQKNAEDVKSGAGQYFTSRPLIKAIVEVMRPEPSMTICDPACGTGGFLLAPFEYISNPNNYSLDESEKEHLRTNALRGWEIVDNTARLCVMNLYLHGISGNESPIKVEDALASDPRQRFNIVLTNPPFGKKSTITIVNDDGKIDREGLTYARQDFWTTTSNKQLNFIQHVNTILEVHGKAAIVVPDNVLFEGGAGETIRKKLLADCDLHTILRLPAGIFYAQGVKANVLFFDKKPSREKPWTEKLWIYDMRTNMHFTLKTKQLKSEDLLDFIQCFNPVNRHERIETQRFRVFCYDELIQRDKTNLDIFWLREDNFDLPDPDILVQEIIENLQVALEHFNGIYQSLSKE